MKFKNVVLGALMLVCGPAMAATIDFDTYSPGYLTNGTVINGVEFTTVSSPGMSLLYGSGDVRLFVFGQPQNGGGILRLDFVDGPVANVWAFIENADQHPVVIDAFDENDNLLEVSPETVNGQGLLWIGRALSDIAYVEIHDHGFDFFVDDIGYEVAPVPLPASAWLLLTGLVMLTGVKRRSALMKKK